MRILFFDNIVDNPVTRGIMTSDRYLSGLLELGIDYAQRQIEYAHIPDKHINHFIGMIEKDIEETNPDIVFFNTYFPVAELAEAIFPTKVIVFLDHIPDPIAFQISKSPNFYIAPICETFASYYGHIGFPRSHILPFSYAAHQDKPMPIRSEEFDYDVAWIGTDNSGTFLNELLKYFSLEDIKQIVTRIGDGTGADLFIRTESVIRDALAHRFATIPADFLPRLCFLFFDYIHHLKVRHQVFEVMKHCMKKGYRFLLAGYGWNRYKDTAGVEQISPELVPDIYNRSKVTFQRNNVTNSTSRPYAAIMSGCLPLMFKGEYEGALNSLSTFYAQGIPPLYSDNNKLLDMIDHYVNDIPNRNILLHELQQETLSHATYYNRFDALLRALT